MERYYGDSIAYADAVVPLNEAEEHTLMKLEQTRLIELIRVNTDECSSIHKRMFELQPSLDKE